MSLLPGQSDKIVIGDLLTVISDDESSCSSDEEESTIEKDTLDIEDQFNPTDADCVAHQLPKPLNKHKKNVLSYLLSIDFKQYIDLNHLVDLKGFDLTSKEEDDNLTSF